MESELLRTHDTMEPDMDFLQPSIPDYALGKEGVQGHWKERGYCGLYWDTAFQPESTPKEQLLGFSMRLLGREGDSWRRRLLSDCCPKRTRSTGTTTGNRVGHMCSQVTEGQGHLEDDWSVWGTTCGVWVTELPDQQ